MTHVDRENLQSSRLIAEQQMRRWALGREIEQRLAEGMFAPRAHEVHPFVAISRQAGTGASEIAKRVGAELHWEVVDRDLLSLMLERMQHGASEFDAVDETSANWLVEVFGKWMDENTLTQQEFVVHLRKVLCAAAQERSCVFVGRGAQFVLPREHGLTVRIVAPREMRVAWARQHLELSRSEAERWVDEHDQGRRDFVRTYFHHDVDDPSQYDLVINQEHYTPNATADLIVAECHRRFPASVGVFH